MYGPLLWLHFNSVIHPETNISFKDIWHFIPLLLLNIYMLDIIIMPDVERMAYFNNQEYFYNRILYLNYVRSLHQIVYAILLYKLYKKYKEEIKTSSEIIKKIEDIIALYLGKEDKRQGITSDPNVTLNERYGIANYYVRSSWHGCFASPNVKMLVI